MELTRAKDSDHKLFVFQGRLEGSVTWPQILSTVFTLCNENGDQLPSQFLKSRTQQQLFYFIGHCLRVIAANKTHFGIPHVAFSNSEDALNEALASMSITSERVDQQAEPSLFSLPHSAEALVQRGMAAMSLKDRSSRLRSSAAAAAAAASLSSAAGSVKDRSSRLRSMSAAAAAGSEGGVIRGRVERQPRRRIKCSWPRPTMSRELYLRHLRQPRVKIPSSPTGDKLSAALLDDDQLIEIMIYRPVENAAVNSELSAGFVPSA